MPMDQLSISLIEAGIGGPAICDAHIISPSVLPLVATEKHSILPLSSSSIGKLQNGVGGSSATEFASRELLPACDVSVQGSPRNESSEIPWTPTSHKDGSLSEPRQRLPDGEGSVLLVKHAKNMEVQMDAKDLIGRVVRKRFGKKRFSGVIDSFDTQYNWYKVVYEDGDEEDLERVEVEALLLPLERSRTALLCKRRSPEGVTEERQLKKNKCLEKVSSAVPSSKNCNREKIVEKGEGGKKKKLGSKIESQGRRSSGTGMTLQEGIKRYLKKREDAGQTPVSTRVKQKAQSTESKTSKRKLSNFEITQNSTSTTMKTIGKLTAGCANKGFVEPGIALLGSSTVKKFGKHFYSGTVISYNKETKLYMVRYEDGDEEELAWRDLKPTLVVLEKHAPTKPILAKEKVEAVRFGAALQGTETRKKFGRKYYNGVVISYDKNRQFYTVEYEDGDQEELELCELEPTLVQNWQGSTGSKKLSATKLIKDRVGNTYKLSHGFDGYSAKLKATNAKLKKRSDAGLRDYLIGSSIRKKFGRKFLNGTVINFDKNKRLYKVRYEDGDEDDLEWSELKRIVILEGSLASKMEQCEGDTLCALEREEQDILVKSINHKSKNESMRTSELEAELIGRSTRKRFGRKFYRGVVVGFNRRSKIYKVKYEDGDEEELEWSQLEPSLVVEGKENSAAKSSSSKLNRKGKTGSRQQ